MILPFRVLVSVSLLAALITACGGNEPDMPTDLAEALAGRADDVAELIEQDDGCAAHEQIEALRSDVEAERGDALPDALAEELLAAVADLEGQVECDPPAPEPDDGDDRDDDEDGKDDKNDDKDKEKDKDDDEGRGPPEDRGRGNDKDD